jgi:hypothetical protein
LLTEFLLKVLGNHGKLIDRGMVNSFDFFGSNIR